MPVRLASSLCALILLASFTLPAPAALTETVSTDQDEIALIAERGFTRIAMPETRVFGAPGAPEIPARVLTFIIPADTRVGGVRVAGDHSETIAERVTPHPIQPEAPTSGEPPAWVEPDRDLYETSGLYPERACVVLGEGFFAGHRLATVALYPVRWRPASGELVFAPEMTVTLELEPATERPRARARVTESGDRLMRELLSRMVTNASDLTVARGDVDVEALGGSSGFRPRHTPSLEGTPVEYLIITSDELAPHFQALADEKTARGIPAVVRTLSWIDANYPGGCDQAERIRFFIQDAYDSWGTTYVLLGGDTDVVPVRMAYTRYYGGHYIPCDLYYSDLDGAWNNDGDERFGEAYSGTADVGDSLDLYADVFLGRAPVRTVVDVENFILKCETYERSPVPHFVDRNLYLAEVLFPYDWSGGAYSLDGAADIVEPSLPDLAAGVRNIKLYANSSEFPESYPISEAAAVDSMGLGYNLVVHVGHGNKDVMRVGLDNYVGLAQVSELANGLDKSGFWWLLNCTSTAIDYDCIAERALRNTNGGASGLIGPTRYAFPATGREYYWDWVNLLYQGGIREAGPLMAATLAGHASFEESGRDNTDRWTQLSLVLLGDPEQRIWTARPRALTVSHPGAVQVGESGMAISVSNPGPVEGARVCIASASGDVYAAGITDATGTVNLWFTPTQTGVLTVTASAPDHAIYEGTITVIQVGGAHLHATGVTILDDGSGATSGNGNALAESGETIELDIEVRNAGTSTAAGVSVEAVTFDPYLVLEQATASAGDIAAGSTTEIPSAVRLSVGVDCPNEWDAEIALQFEDASRATWTDTVEIRLLAAAPKILRTDLDDSVGGDGDGVAEMGETITLTVEMFNDGNGVAENLTGTLRYPGWGIAFTDSTDTWGSIPEGTAATGQGGFEMLVSAHLHDDFELECVDTYGRTWMTPMDIARPEPPDTLWGRVKGTTILLYWEQSVSQDVRGYDIWRSGSETGPYSLINSVPIETASYYADEGLEENTRYYYRVVAVSTSGLESLGGQVMTISTNPPSLPGWPLTTSGGMYASAAVYDLDGDGSKEVIVASDEIYAWGVNGIEVLDGDGDPRTDGLFAIEGAGGYRCSAAVGEVDGDAQPEIVAAAWSNVGTEAHPIYEVFAWNAEDGSVVPGWPAVTKRFCWASPALADLDDDGRSEVIIPCADGKLYCWRYDGSELLDGDGDPLTTGVFADLVNYYIYASPAVADIDGDGSLEIIQPAASDSVFCFEIDGSRTPGWPIYTENRCYSSPSVGDVDGDGDLEVAITSKAWRTWIFDHEGNALPGWPKEPAINGDFPPSPVLADLSGNGELELIQVSSTGEIWVWDYAGNTLAGWPVQLGGNSKSSPAVADVDGDAGLEIIVGCDDGRLYAFDDDGELLNGWPIQTDAEIYGSPAVDDLDGDGDNEVVIGGMDTNVYVYDTAGLYSDGDGVEWGVFLHDTWRTQFHGFSEPVTVPDEPDVPQEPVTRLVLEQNRPNPFNPTTEIHYIVPGSSAARVTLTVYAVDGSVVRTLLDDRVGAGPGKVVWGGRDDRGQRVPSGVYLYRLSGVGETVTKKMVLLK